MTNEASDAPRETDAAQRLHRSDAPVEADVAETDAGEHPDTSDAAVEANAVAIADRKRHENVSYILVRLY